MKGIISLLIGLAVGSLIVGLISRLTLVVFPVGLTGNSFLQFTNTCLLFAIAGILLMIRDK